MQTIKARGLVLREYEAGESDKRLLLLCKEHGRMMIYARGARKPKSKFMAAAQLFTYADFVLARGRGFYALTQAEVIESFYGIRTDYDCLTAAHLIAEVCEKTLLEDIACDDLLLLALKSFMHLNKSAQNCDALVDGKNTYNLPPAQIIGVFFMRFYAQYGLTPEVEACTVCGMDINEISGLSRISGTNGGAYLAAEGLVCRAHRPGVCIKLSEVAIYTLRHILSSDLSGAFMFKARDDVLAELRGAAQMLWRCHFEWNLMAEKYM